MTEDEQVLLDVENIRNITPEELINATLHILREMRQGWHDEDE